MKRLAYSLFFFLMNLIMIVPVSSGQQASEANNGIGQLSAYSKQDVYNIDLSTGQLSGQ